MSSEGGSDRGAGTGLDTSAAPAMGERVLHPRSFKLRFAAQREPGRSYISAVKPLTLPATVTDKFYQRSSTTESGEDKQRYERALRRIQDTFSQGPREKYPAAVTTAHEYGWWWERLRDMESTERGDRRVRHYIRDSWWLTARLRVLAADQNLKHN